MPFPVPMQSMPGRHWASRQASAALRGPALIKAPGSMAQTLKAILFAAAALAMAVGAATAWGVTPLGQHRSGLLGTRLVGPAVQPWGRQASSSR